LDGTVAVDVGGGETEVTVGVIARGHRPELAGLPSRRHRVAQRTGAVAATAEVVGKRRVHDGDAERREVLLRGGEIVVELDAHKEQLRLRRHLVRDLRDGRAVLGVAVESTAPEATGGGGGAAADR